MKTWKKIGLSVVFTVSATLCALGAVACGGKDGNALIEEKATAITNAGQLKSITNGSYALQSDIDLQGEEWFPIASFTGKLDGKGYKIYNFKLQQSQAGLGFVEQNNGVIKNVVFDEVTLTARGEKSSTGIIAGVNNGTIENCIVNGEVDASYCKWVGGIVGHNTATGIVKGCENNAMVTAGDIVGGIAGYSQGTLKNCDNNVVVTGKNCVGGIAGVVSGTCDTATNIADITASTSECGGIFGAVEASCGELKNLTNSGKVVCEGKHTGGIVGRMWSSTTVQNVDNTGSVEGTDSVGGVFGACEAALNVVAFENIAPVTGTYYVGGIVGWAMDGSTFKGCKNSGVITAKCYQGGLVGGGWVDIIDGQNTGLLVHSDGKIIEQVLYSYFGGIAGQCRSLENCSNVASVTGVGDCVGGLAGITQNATKCTNTVFVKGANQVGGIAGKGNNADGVSNSGKIEGVMDVGGIYGIVNGEYNVQACENEGEIKGSDNVGGIVGRALEGVTFIDNENKGIVTGMGYVGGVLGYLKIGTLTGNINSGSVTAEIKVGGLVGFAFYPTIKYCENKGLVSADNEVGGIVGEADGDVYLINYKYNEKRVVNVTDCKNSGVIKGNVHVGGIFGQVSARVTSASVSETVDVMLEKLVNTGNVTAYRSVGGIGGLIDGVYGEYRYNYKIKTVKVYYHLNNCTNSATVTGNEALGGLVGELGNYAVIEDTCIDTGMVKEIG